MQLEAALRHSEARARSIGILIGTQQFEGSRHRPTRRTEFVQFTLEFDDLFGCRIGVGEPCGPHINAEHFHYGFGCAKVAIIRQQLDEKHGTELLLPGCDQVAPIKGGEQALINRGGEIIAAPHRAPGTQSHGAQEKLVHAPGNVEGPVIRLQAKLVGHQVVVGELDAAEGEMRSRARARKSGIEKLVWVRDGMS